jgi:hypothetical protein
MKHISLCGMVKLSTHPFRSYPPVNGPRYGHASEQTEPTNCIISFPPRWGPMSMKGLSAVRHVSQSRFPRQTGKQASSHGRRAQK